MSGLGFHCNPIRQWFLAIKKETKIKHCLQPAILEEHRFKKLQYLLLCFCSLVPRGEGPPFALSSVEAPDHPSTGLSRSGRGIPT